jgi:hypothetical protein
MLKLAPVIDIANCEDSDWLQLAREFVRRYVPPGAAP